jgi:hypothetical protein
MSFPFTPVSCAEGELLKALKVSKVNFNQAIIFRLSASYFKDMSSATTKSVIVKIEGAPLLLAINGQAGYIDRNLTSQFDPNATDPGNANTFPSSGPPSTPRAAPALS